PELARQELRRRRLLEDDVDNVVAGEVAGLAEERLRPVIMQNRPEDVALAGAVDAVAGERAGGGADVVLAVVAGAHGEELHQLPREVLVGVRSDAGLQVQVDHHRWLAGDALEDVREASVGGLPLEDVLVVKRANAAYAQLIEAAGVQAVPEEGELFDSWLLGRGHATQPPEDQVLRFGGVADG